MTEYLLIVVAVGVLVSFVRWVWSDSEESSSVIDVRRTAERRIEDLTVEDLHERTKEFLMDEGYRLEAAGENGDYLAHRDGDSRFVRIDPAAELGDPRKMNQLILQLRRSDAEAGVVVTTRPIDGQSRSLAEKSSIRIIEPDELLSEGEESDDS